MKDQIFIINDSELTKLEESEFHSEDQFQLLLERYPDLLAGSQIKPESPRKWLFISREYGVPDEENGSNKWSLDHLFIDQDGIPTLVEVKRSTDTRIRREVVGQMLDYAANAVSYWSIEEIKSKYESFCDEISVDPEVNLLEKFENQVSISNFWETVNTNLKAGKIRLLFVADRIPSELKRIIEFLNEQMSPAEVLGLELKHFSNESVKTLVPRIIGQTSYASSKKNNSGSYNWNNDSFFEELGNRFSNEYCIVVNKILDHYSSKISRIWYGNGRRNGSLIPVTSIKEVDHYPFAFWTNGKIEFYFQYYRQRKPFDNFELRKKLFDLVSEIEGVSFPKDKVDKRPSIDLNLLFNKNSLNKFFEIYDWYYSKIEDGS